MDFEIYFLIFFKFGDFKILFEILKTSNMSIVKKMTLYNKIIFQSKEIVYIWVDYTGLSKSRSFIMIKIYPTTSNVILNSTIFKIAILVNFMKKTLKIDKSIQIATIYKYIDIIYFIINISGVLIVLTTILTTIFEFLSSVQRDIILGFRYQYINLIDSSF